ncbi:MAG: peptidase T, partial [Phycisphaerae bacterium]
MSDLLERFLRYVKVESTAVEVTTDYPSSPGQLEMGRMLAEELTAIGAQNVSQDEFGIVMATVPGNVDGAPTIAWFAHVDTAPDYTAKNVNPIVLKNYDGKDIVLRGDKTKMIREANTPELPALKGKTLITTDGTTLLGADDKAGVAVIMTAAARLLENPGIPHGPIRVVFTCDEEVGRGTSKLDLAKINATCGYTLDGDSAGKIENETFSADGAVVTFTGVNIHPGLATGKMINALRAAGTFLGQLPHDASPEKTSAMQGFIHPYLFEGNVEKATVRFILRSFSTQELKSQAETLRGIAEQVRKQFSGIKIEVDVKEQYRNMREYLEKEP